MEIDLKNTVPFVWDELYLFSEYRPRADICKQLKLTDRPCSRHVSVESVAEGEMFLVFRHKGTIVHTEMHRVFNGDFAPLDYPQPITPERARFIVKEDGKFVNGEPLFRLRPKS